MVILCMLITHSPALQGFHANILNLPQSTHRIYSIRPKVPCEAERRHSLLILGKGYTGGGLSNYLQHSEEW